MSLARSTVWAPLEEVEISSRGAEREHHGGDRAEQAAGQREADPEAAESRGAVAHRGAQVGEHERDRHEAEAAADRGQQHGGGACRRRTGSTRSQAGQRADAARRPARASESMKPVTGASLNTSRWRRREDDQQRADRGRDRGPRALLGLPLEGLPGWWRPRSGRVRSGGPPMGVRAPPAPSSAAAARGRSRSAGDARDRSPAKSSRSRAGAATRIRDSIRRTWARWAG